MSSNFTAREWILQNYQEYSSRSKCIQDCAREVKIGERSARRTMLKLETQGMIPDASWYCPEVSGTVERGRGKPKGVTNNKRGFAQFDLIANVPHTPEELVEMCNLDVDIWELKKGRVNFWGNYNNPNYQTRVEFIRKVSEAGEKFLEKVKQDMMKFSPKYPKITYPTLRQGESFLLEPSIYDIHFGSMSCEAQSKDLYNPQIAQSRFYEAVVQILAWYQGVNIDQILFPIGHDLFNTDNRLGTTTKGTPQDEHWDYQETYQIGFQTLVESIDLLQAVAPVYVPIISSNHDRTRIFYLGHALEAWYHNNPNVTIDNRGLPYKFHSYGTNLIGMTHSDGIKKKNLPLLMATESKDLWSKCKYYEWHIGHWHRSNIQEFLSESEKNGVRVRMLPSLCGRDFWHTYKGYGSMKEAVGLLWSKHDGNISDYKFHI